MYFYRAYFGYRLITFSGGTTLTLMLCMGLVQIRLDRLGARSKMGVQGGWRWAFQSSNPSTLDVPEDVHIYSMLKVIINMCLTLRSFTVDL
jgi:hypothetical protein